MKDSVEISFCSSEGKESRSDRINNAAGNNGNDELNRIFTVFIKRIDQRKAHPAENHIQNGLNCLETLLVNICKHSSGNADSKTERNHNNRERPVIRKHADDHDRYARSGNQNVYYRVVNNTHYLFDV